MAKSRCPSVGSSQPEKRKNHDDVNKGQFMTKTFHDTSRRPVVGALPARTEPMSAENLGAELPWQIPSNRFEPYYAKQLECDFFGET